MNQRLALVCSAVFASAIFSGASVRAAGGQPAPVTAAVAFITPTAGHHATGTVAFTQTASGVKVVADISGLSPGSHGFHIHEYGDITDTKKGMKTGGHYDPEGSHHHMLMSPDHPSSMPHHVGDMGNLVADASGKAHLEIMLPDVTLTGPKNAIVGRAVIVHEKADDGSQPTGNAGGRIGQGVIGIAKGA